MEEPAGRSRRAVRPASKAAGALAQLAELRRTGVKHVNAYEFKEEDAVFDVVAEDDYADIVARRRGDAGALRRACWLNAPAILRSAAESGPLPWAMWSCLLKCGAAHLGCTILSYTSRWRLSSQSHWCRSRGPCESHSAICLDISTAAVLLQAILLRTTTALATPAAKRRRMTGSPACSARRP